MAVKKGITKAEFIAASEAAARGGRTWAQRFIELVREQPKNYALQGWIDDAEHYFKGNPEELNDFYMTLQAACLGQRSPETDPTSTRKTEAADSRERRVESKYVLEHDQVKEIRHVLLIGLASFGEIERLSNARDLYEIGGEKVPEDLSPVHPTGNADTASLFAAALLDLEYSKENPQSPAAA